MGNCANIPVEGCTPRMTPETYIGDWKNELNSILHELIIGSYGRPAESLQDRLIHLRSSMENYVGTSSRISYDG